MTPRGTSDVTLTAWLGGDDGGAMAYEVAQRFARRARESGSLVLVSSAWRWVPDPTVGPDDPPEPPVLELTLRYRHTCRNRWNHTHDARRFFENALKVGDDDEWYGDVEAIQLNDWRPA